MVEVTDLDSVGCEFESHLGYHYLGKNMKLFYIISNNIKYVIWTYLASLILGSLLFSYIENQSLINSFYWCCITSLTIGYGDISPQTSIGKVLSIILGHFWIFFIIPSVISHILSNMIQDRNVFTHEEQEEIKSTLKLIQKKLNHEI